MSRRIRSTKLETRDARSKLPHQDQPYWRSLIPGIILGYRKGPRGGVWVVRRLVDGKYTKRRLGLANDHADADGEGILDYEQAHRKAIQMTDTAREHSRASIDTDRTVRRAVDEYMQWYAVHRKGADIVQHSVNKHINPKLGPKKIGDLTAGQLRTWHQGIAGGRTKATANRVLTILKAALNRAWEDGHCPSPDAWRRVKPFKGADTPKVRFLSHEECTRLLRGCEPDFRDLVQGALVTGCRYGELIALRAEDYHDDSGTTVRLVDTKANKPRHVPLTDEGQQLFDRLTAGVQHDDHVFVKADGSPWGRHHQIRRVRDASVKAKISPAVNFHVLRHTYGSLLAQKGVPLHVIASAMGHADTRMTSRHYAHLMPSYVAETIRANLPTFDRKRRTTVTRLSGKQR